MWWQVSCTCNWLNWLTRMNKVQRLLISILLCTCLYDDILRLRFKSDWPVIFLSFSRIGRLPKPWCSVRVWRSKGRAGRAFVSTSTVLPSVSIHFITIILIVRCCDFDDSWNVVASNCADAESVHIVVGSCCSKLGILLSIWWIASVDTLLLA